MASLHCSLHALFSLSCVTGDCLFITDAVLSRSFKLPAKAENAAVLIEPRQHYGESS